MSVPYCGVARVVEAISPWQKCTARRPAQPQRKQNAAAIGGLRPASLGASFGKALVPAACPLKPARALQLAPQRVWEHGPEEWQTAAGGAGRRRVPTAVCRTPVVGTAKSLLLRE